LQDLDWLLAQSQEQISSVSRIPLVKWTGISPSGLNASSEGEIRVYYDLIHSEQIDFTEARALTFAYPVAPIDVSLCAAATRTFPPTSYITTPAQ
jgi:Protein of unknown function (DUF1073)